jgi:hypothetical protein
MTDQNERTGPIRCQCTLASESQIKAIFQKFAADNPRVDITYADVNAGMNDIGRHNADHNVPNAQERDCMGCDPLLHMLVKQFNESHDPDALFVRKRQGGRAQRLKDMGLDSDTTNSGLCGVAQGRDYTSRDPKGAIPDLRGSPINAPRKKVG